jgi:hypothetical protein
VYTTLSETSAMNGRWRATVLMIVFALFCVPPLVRATGPLESTSTPLLRLNRGVDVPESKCRVAPQTDQVVAAGAMREVSPVGRPIFLDLFAEPLVPGVSRSPAALRGPPSVSLA